MPRAGAPLSTSVLVNDPNIADTATPVVVVFSSVVVNVCGPPLSTGASFTAVTVRTKVSLAEFPDGSVTVTVIVEEPFRLATGVTVTFRLPSVPPKTMFELGTKVVSLEEPVSVRLAAAVWVSLIVAASAPVFASSLIVWAAILLIVGATVSITTDKAGDAALVFPAASVAVAVIL